MNVTGAGSKITATNGTLQVTGTGGQTNPSVSSSNGSNVGVMVESAGQIAGTGTATVTVTGAGGGLGTGLTSNNHGVLLQTLGSGVAPTITSEGGAVLVTGTGGGTGGTGTTNHGVSVTTGGLISNIGDGGTVTVNGTGGGGSNATASNSGIFLEGCTTVSNYTITANNGTIALTGIEGTGSESVGLAANATRAGVIGNATTAGNITILADSVALATWPGSAVNSGIQLTIAPRTGGVGVNLGADSNPRGGPLGLSNGELNTLSAGTIRLGSASSGNVTISAAVTVPSGSNLTLASSGVGTALIPTACATGLTYTAGKTLDVSALPAVNLSIAGTSPGIGYTQLKVNGDLSIAGKTLNLSGGYTPTGGNVFTIVSATNLTGTFTGLTDGSTVTFNGRTLIVNYTSSSVTLTDPAPLVTSSPGSAIVNAGDTASFTAAASGMPTPTVQWQLDSGSGFANIPGATATTYSFTATAGDNGHQYRAVFSNAYGTATSSAATFTVQFAPTVTTQPAGGTFLPGTTTTLTAASSGNPTATVQWQVDTGSGWSDVAGATTTSLGVVVSAGMSARQYRAVFTNAVGTATTASASVQAATSITSQIRAVRTGLVLDRSTGRYNGTITLTNTGSTALAAISMMLSGLASGVTLANASGTVTDGTSYMSTGPLAAGQSITLRLSFRKLLSTTSVSYTSLFYLTP